MKVEHHERVRLSVSEENFLTFEAIPAGLDRSIVPIVEMAQPEVSGDPIDVVPIGTAFLIGRLPTGEALFVSARHNVPASVLEHRGNLVAMLPKASSTGPKPELQGTIVTGVSMAETSSDVALLVAPVDDTVRVPALTPLSLEQPQVGQNCLALGYSEMVIGQQVSLSADALIRLSSSRGKIEEVHPSHRDNAKITFPSFRTDALYAHGMSGGPVISAALSSHAIGIVSTCMESIEDGSHIRPTAHSWRESLSYQCRRRGETSLLLA